MYSRYNTPRRETLQVPENYSGCAFSKASAPPVIPHPHDPPPVVKAPLPIPVHALEEAEAPPAPPSPAPPPPIAPKAEREGILSWIKDGEEFDRFLILGLIALLLHSGEDKEIVLWLSLLLFC